MKPDPTEVAGTLERLMASDWPTTPAETDAWLAEHRIAPPAVVEAPSGVPGARSWMARPMPGVMPGVGWHTFEDEFVGVNWFLWPSDDHDAVLAEARTLADEITAHCGIPADAHDAEQGFTRLWRSRGFTVDLYAHDGHAHPPGRPDGPSVVQLHLDHTVRADALETAARRRALGSRS